MESTHVGLLTIVFFVFCANLQSMTMVHCINIQDLDDLIRSYAARDNTTRRQTGSLHEISLPSNLSDIKASVVTVRNSVLWRKGANFSGVCIPPFVKTTPYAKRIALIYEIIGNQSSSVYFRLSKNYSFVSPVIGFSVYDATNTNDLKKLNLSINRDNLITIRFDLDNRSSVKGIKCVAFGDNGTLLNMSNTRGNNYECGARGYNGHYGLVVINKKVKPGSVNKRKWRWWFGLIAIGISVIAVVVLVMVKIVVRKKRLREMERETDKSEIIGDILISGRSRMPVASMVRTQPSLEFCEHLPSSSSI
ncbi:unnamed protein product [Cochlearia groenlandica]